MTGLESGLTCNWDQQSISQLDLSAFNRDTSKIALLNFIGRQLKHSFEKRVVMENLVISAVEELAKLAEDRDPETGNHLLRMNIYSSIIVQELKNNSHYSN